MRNSPMRLASATYCRKPVVNFGSKTPEESGIYTNSIHKTDEVGTFWWSIVSTGYSCAQVRMHFETPSSSGHKVLIAVLQAFSKPPSDIENNPANCKYGS